MFNGLLRAFMYPVPDSLAYHRMRLVVITASALIFLSSVGANAQGTPPAALPTTAGIGEIRGYLTDSTSGHAVVSGSITIRRQNDTTFAGGTLPKPDGTFRVDGLAPGRYTLRFRALGLSPVTKYDLVITAEK